VADHMPLSAPADHPALRAALDHAADRVRFRLARESLTGAAETGMIEA